MEKIQSPDDVYGESICVLTHMTGYPGEVKVLFNDEGPRGEGRSYLTEAGFLANVGTVNEFVKSVEDTYNVFYTESIQDILKTYRQWNEPLQIEGLTLKSKDGREPGLFPYQNFGLNKALSFVETDLQGMNTTSFHFFSYGTGTGKTVVGSSGALELLNRGQIDLALVFTLRQVKSDFTNFINTATPLLAKNVEGDKSKRVKEYEKDEAHVYVMNYEKAKFDFEDILKLVRGRRVLFVFDEVQKILNNNQSRKSIDKLLSSVKKKIIWPMSASVVQGDPERFWKVFEWAPSNPLGTLKDFRQRYVKEVRNRSTFITTRSGKKKKVHYQERIYDQDKLNDVRHRISHYTHTVRKTDPGVRELFKGLVFTPVPVDMSIQTRQVYDKIESLYEEDFTKGSELPLYQALRYTCLFLPSHHLSHNQISEAISKNLGDKLVDKNNNKLERMMDDIESIRDQGDKCVVFTHWTTLSLFFLAKELEKRKVPYVIHHGRQKSYESEKSKTAFKEDPKITVFLSSDAGSHGLNLPMAKYVLSYECPYDYDTLMQRNDRIDRADSYLDGLEARVYYYRDSVEERIWYLNNERRHLSSTLQGTNEVLGRNNTESIPQGAQELKYLITGR